MLNLYNLYVTILYCLINPSIAIKSYRIAGLVSGERRISSSSSQSSRPKVFHAKCEFDSHADTTVAGRNFIVTNYIGKECDVHAFSDDCTVIKNVPLARVATAWQSPETAQTYILVINEALWMGDTMDMSLINPNQLRNYGIHIQDDPTSNRPLSLITANTEFAMTLNREGTIISFDSRTPTQQELESCPHIILSSEKSWSPHNAHFSPNPHSLEEEVERIRRVATTSTSLEIDDTLPTQVNNNDKDTIFDLTKIMKVLSTMRVSSARPKSHIMSKNKNEQEALVRPSILQDKNTDVQELHTFQSSSRHSDVSAHDLSERWFIGLNQATKTLQKTTQNLLRSAVLPLSRRYRADRMFRRKTLNGKWSTDTLDGHCVSLDGNKYAQVFANERYFSKIYPMDTKSKAGDALKVFCREFGVPFDLTFDGSKEQCNKNTTFMKQIRKCGIKYHVSEPNVHNQNPVEGVIREIRRKWFRTMVRKRVPRKLWDYGMVWCSEVISLTHSTAGPFGNGIPQEFVTGETEDISEYLDFGFYDMVWYKDNGGLSEEKPGRWLGVSHNTGRLMCYHILTSNGSIVSRSTVQRVTNLERQKIDIKELFVKFDVEIHQRLKEPARTYEGAKPNPQDWADLLEEDDDFAEEFNNVFNNTNIPEADKEITFPEGDHTPEVFQDTYLDMEVALPRDTDGPEFAKVTKRLRDANGIPIGTSSDNPILDTRLYEVEYMDGHKASLTANSIAQNMFAQVDEEGNRHVILDSIIDYRTNGKEVQEQNAFIKSKNGGRRRKETTKGWEILLGWKDGSSTWEAMKDIKESYPVDLAEFAIQKGIDSKPAFAWWIPFVIKKKQRIISKVKSKYWTKTHKFGIRIPRTVKEAIEIDTLNKNTLWWAAICQEMKNVRIAFEIFDGNKEDIPPGYQLVDCHMIFDIKMGENFRRKARMVAGGHQTSTPSTITYSSVVSRDSVRIALTIAALNNLQVLGCDIQNAYLTAKCREKIWTIAGPEFGSESGKIMLVVRALYGLKSSGAAFRALLAEVLHDMGYRPSYADPDVWMRPGIKPCGFEYWEYVLCYVDDVLSISDKPMSTMKQIQQKFKLKNDKIEEPTSYLGADLSKMENQDGDLCWAMSSEKYCTATVDNIKSILHKKGLRLPNKCVTPLSSGYRPEMDVTAELKADGVQWYQEMIGQLRWAIEIGRVDILLEVSLLSQHLALPREGHLEQVIHVMGYLNDHKKLRLMFDKSAPSFNEKFFDTYDWTDFYRGAHEKIPPNMPTARGLEAFISIFVDADHAGNKVNRRSQTGILIFLNRAPIHWFSKAQPSVESSTFGAEFCAMKTGVEMVEALRYKLRMFGVPINEDSPANVFCDNEAVYKNTSIPSSTLNKKHHSIAYHICREAVAAKVIRVAKQGTTKNLSDLFTKIMTAARRRFLLERFTY